MFMQQEMMGWQWHQWDSMQLQVICILLQRDNHVSTSSLNFLTARMFFLMSNQRCLKVLKEMKSGKQ